MKLLRPDVLLAGYALALAVGLVIAWRWWSLPSTICVFGIGACLVLAVLSFSLDSTGRRRRDG